MFDGMEGYELLGWQSTISIEDGHKPNQIGSRIVDKVKRCDDVGDSDVDLSQCCNSKQPHPKVFYISERQRFLNWLPVIYVGV